MKGSPANPSPTRRSSFSKSSTGSGREQASRAPGPLLRAEPRHSLIQERARLAPGGRRVVGGSLRIGRLRIGTGARGLGALPVLRAALVVGFPIRGAFP